MKRLSISLAFFGFLSITGCGPLTTPMVPRLEPEAQKSIDDSWEKALAPIDRLDHQALLDILVGTAAYQFGVDKLYLRSEKRFSGGLVVMEIHFDRAIPDEDRFEVKIIAENGKALRHERYNRKDVENTYRDLSHNPPAKDDREAAQLAEKREARWAKIREFFPQPKEEAKK